MFSKLQNADNIRIFLLGELKSQMTGQILAKIGHRIVCLESQIIHLLKQKMGTHREDVVFVLVLAVHSENTQYVSRSAASIVYEGM